MKTLTKKIVSIAVIMLLCLQGAVPVSAQPISLADATVLVSTYGELKEAINNRVNHITIADDIEMEETIIIDYTVSIVGDARTTLYATRANERHFSISGATVSFENINLNGRGTGGGLYCVNGATLSITDSTIQNNMSQDFGGGITANAWSEVNITGCTIKNNFAEDSGGGIYADYFSTVNITDSTIQSNTASNGGGVYAYYDTPVNITNSMITNNTVSGSGGGVYIDSLGSLAADEDTIFSGNTARAAYIMTSASDIALHERQIKTTHFSEAFEYGYNNYDINYTKGIQVVNPESVTVNPSSAAIQIGETQELVALVLPAEATQSVTWSSSDISVATVDNEGIVTGMGEGIATITAATVNGLTADATIIVSGLPYTEVRNFAELKTAINNQEEHIVITADIQMEGSITINYDTSISGFPSAILLSSGQGRHFTINNANIVFENIAFNGNGRTGGLSCINSIVAVDNCTIADNSEYEGSGLFIYYSEVTIINSTITGNSGIYGGGLSSSASTVSIIDSTITDNYAVIGGGLRDTGSDVRITNSIFQGNSSNYGGGLRFTDSEVSVENSTIENNSASHGGGVFAHDSQIRIIVSTINDNFAQGDSLYGGGGLYTSSSEVSIIDSTIENNTTSYTGGGIDSTDSTLNIINSTIASNIAKTDGGGIHSSADTVSIAGSTIQSNSIERYDGGGLYVSEGTVNITASTIGGNYAPYHGGGMYADHCEVNIDDSSVKGNTAFRNGGGLYVSSTIVSMINNIIAGNSAWYSYGGGLFSDSSDVSIISSTVEGNVATSGGGLSSRNADGGVSTIIVMDTVIEKNSASYYGGGIYAYYDTTVSIENSTIIKNDGGYYGGGIYSYNLHSLFADSDTVFSNNKARTGYFMTDSDDIALHNISIKATHFTEPFRYGYNNYDINYTKGTPLE